MSEYRVRFVAADDETRARGLMHSAPLSDDEVAFFVFPRSDRYAFWNRNVSFPITLAFLDEHGIVVDIGQLDAHQEEAVRSAAEARFVVEASRGSFEKMGVQTGDVMRCDGKTLKVGRCAG
jgi:uncharacterized protein